LTAGVDHLTGGVVVDVAVGQHVDPGEQRQRLLGGGPVVGPPAGGRVVGLGGAVVAARLVGVVGVDRLDHLADAADDEQLAAGQRDDRRVPAAVVHLGGLVPGVGGVVVDPGVGQALELDQAVVGPGDGRLLVVVGAAGGQHGAV